MDADDAPPVVRGLAVIDDGGFVTMGEGGNEIESKTILIIISRIYISTKLSCNFDYSYFLSLGSLLIKEVAPVGTRIAKLVVTDRKSAELESNLRFSLLNELVQKLPIFDRLPKRQIMFPGGKQIKADDVDGSKHSFDEDQGDILIGAPVDPINRHFAVSLFIHCFR